MKAYLELKEIEQLEKSATNMRDKLLIRLLFRLGCRVSEAIALTVADIDMKQGTITIQHLKSRIRVSCPNCGSRLGRTHTYCPQCGSKVDQVVAREQAQRRVRTLPIDNDTLQLLGRYIKRGGPVTKNGKLMIFSINRHRAWGVIRDCADRAGLGPLVNPATGKQCGISPHRLRDAFAVNAIKQDGSSDGLRLLQEHLGHQSFNTTARYRKISGVEHRDWYQKLWMKGEAAGGKAETR